MLLYTAPNLITKNYAEMAPWDWEPQPTELTRLRAMSKAARRNYITQETTHWNVYSCFRGIVPHKQIDADNPPAGVRAFCADFDAVLTPQAAMEVMKNHPVELLPNWIEVSLGGNLRGVWLFEQEFNTPSMGHAEALAKEVAKLVRAERLLPAYDSASVRCTMRWTNGGEWYSLNGTQPLATTILHGLSCEAAKHVDFGRAEIELSKIGEEVNRRWPNRWVGDFVQGAVGVRFWDEKADNPRGAYVTPTGCFCLTGGVTFMTWDDIFGPGWVREHRALHLGEAAAGVHFDKANYWRKVGEHYMDYGREDTVLYLTGKGLNSTKPKHGTISDAGRVLLHIQEHNRVDAAVPLIFREVGPQFLNGSKVLNISRVKALTPAAEPSSPEQFPWLHDFIQRLFVGEHAQQSFLAWMKRSYKGAYELRPMVGQAIFLAGPGGNGKSLLCTRIIAPLLGGKMANPYDYLMKLTSFNDEIFESGLLAINDEDAPKTEKEKEVFLQRVKSIVVNQRHQMHAKFGKRIEIEWTGGRVVVTMNDDAKSVLMLPEVNANTSDKMMFFRTRPYGKAWLDKYDLEAKIAQELPYFGRWLIDTFQPDPSIMDPGTRNGVKSYFDTELIELSKQQESAYELHELLVAWFNTSVFWSDGKVDEWSGTPTDLLSIMGASGEMHHLLKEWTVQRLARALSTLARVDDDAVIARADRDYLLKKSKILHKHQLKKETAEKIEKALESESGVAS